jgi:hypothetical protein
MCPPRLASLVRRSYETDLGGVGAFLPARVPLQELPAPFGRFLAACGELPDRYPRERGGVRPWLDREFRDDDGRVRRAIGELDRGQADALMTALCALGHTYRWDSVPPAAARFDERSIPLPPGIAGPWGVLSTKTGQPRVGSAWSLHLTNWTMTDRPGGACYRPDELSRASLSIARNWLQPPVAADLENFSLSFVLMEAAGGDVLAGIVQAVESVARRGVDETLVTLQRLHAAISAMTLGFSRNVRRRTVDPDVWLELIQPTYAWGALSDCPGRIEGGPSGMQLGTIQALDAALGIGGRSPIAQLATTARRSMPGPHRRFLRVLDAAGPALRAFVANSGSAELTTQFDACVTALSSFRATHRARGALYLRSRPSGEVSRASTGLSIGVGDEPVGTFERAMNERIAETQCGVLRAVRPVGCPEFHPPFTLPI